MQPNIKKHNQTKIMLLRQQRETLDKKYQSDADKLARQFNIDFDLPNLAENENYYEYLEWYGELSYNHDCHVAQTEAKIATQLLMGYDIARSGRPLYEDTLQHHLGKIPEPDKKFIYSVWNRSEFNSPIAGHLPIFHQELFRNNISLLDKKYCLAILNGVNSLVQSMYAVGRAVPFPLLQKFEDELNDYRKKLMRFKPELRHRCKVDPTLFAAKLYLTKLKQITK